MHSSNLLRAIGAAAALATLAVGCGGPAQQPLTNYERTLVRITATPNDELLPQVSPDGSKILYTQKRIDLHTGIDNYDVWYTNVQTGAPPVLVTTHVADDIYPTWTPDGENIVFTTNHDGLPHLWSRSASGVGGSLSLMRGGAVDIQADVSKDGTKICYASTQFGVTKQVGQQGGKNGPYALADDEEVPFIWVMNRDGSELTQLVEGLDPAFSPDGEQIAFSSMLGGSYDVWIINTDGSHLVQISSDEADEIEPTWSPDGKFLSFSSDLSGNWDIWVIGSDGTTPVQMTTNTGDDSSPTWSVDNFIYFESDRSGNYDVWRLTPPAF